MTAEDNARAIIMIVKDTPTILIEEMCHGEYHSWRRQDYATMETRIVAWFNRNEPI